jgi:hypothetical protein
MKKFLFTKITHTRKVQNFEVMPNNFRVQESYSKFEAHVTKAGDTLSPRHVSSCDVTRAVGMRVAD